jgi:ribosome-associated toxin RatA of RatAB toxin-antitoxin module
MSKNGGVARLPHRLQTFCFFGAHSSQLFSRKIMPTIPLQFSDEILVPHPPATVWSVLANMAEYPAWWPQYLFIHLLHAEADLIGTEFTIRPYGWRSFLCRVTSFDKPASICLQYDSSYMRGTAQWRLEPAQQGTRVIYAMDATTHDVMVYLTSFIISLQSIHSSSMRAIFRNLANQLRRIDPPA